MAARDDINKILESKILKEAIKDSFEKDNKFFEYITKDARKETFRSWELNSEARYIILGKEPKHLGDFVKLRAEALLDKIFDFMIEYKISGRYPCAMPQITYDYSDETDNKSFIGFNISLSKHQAASYSIPLMADVEEAAVYVKEFFAKKPRQCDICHGKKQSWDIESDRAKAEKEIISARDMRVPLNLRSKTPFRKK